MSDRHSLILSPVSDPIPVEGSTRLRADCGHLCWVAPGSRHLLGSTDTQCLPCFGGNDAIREAFREGTARIADPAEVHRALFKRGMGG